MHDERVCAEWRNLARHEVEFHDLLYARLRASPWMLISMMLHGLIFLVGSATFFTAPRLHLGYQDSLLITDVRILHGDPESLILDAELRDGRSSTGDAVESIDDEADRPHLLEEGTEEEESPLDEQDEDRMADGAFIRNVPFDGPVTNATIGIGGGASTAYGGRGGRRGLRSMGGGASTQMAVDLALHWLKNHQGSDGAWDCDGFSEQCKLNLCDGEGSAEHDAGVTGLALLSFLGAGETHRHGAYKKTVRNAAKYLKGIQDAEGCFGERNSGQFMYSHAICTLAMSELFGLTGSPLFKQSAQKGVMFLERCRNPEGAWRYGMADGENDTSVTGWAVMALSSAKEAGLRVDPAGFEGAIAWLDFVTDVGTGAVGYRRTGSGSSRPKDLMDVFPPERTESLTAVGMIARILAGQDPAKTSMIRRGAALCRQRLPVWDETSGDIDMYYWYCATLAMFQMGGDDWKTWNEWMKPAILESQRREGDEKGSWDPVGPWGRAGGRVYSTALMTLCLEVYYRYPRVFGAR